MHNLPVSRTLLVEDILVEVVRKKVKTMRLMLYPPEGRVRITVPLRVNEATIRAAILSKIAWIKRQQTRIKDQKRLPTPEYRSGENHFFQGQLYRLEVVSQPGKPGVVFGEGGQLVLIVPPSSGPAQRERALQDWYRQQLKTLIPPLISKWERQMGVQVRAWGVKRMKTRWGSCNVAAHRIWLNLELIKRSPRSLEYVLVHEMVHLLERHHNARFKTLMTQFLPEWRLLRKELDLASPIHPHRMD